MAAAVTVLRGRSASAAGLATCEAASSDSAPRPAPAMAVSAPPLSVSHAPAARHGTAQASDSAPKPRQPHAVVRDRIANSSCASRPVHRVVRPGTGISGFRRQIFRIPAVHCHRHVCRAAYDTAASPHRRPPRRELPRSRAHALSRRALPGAVRFPRHPAAAGPGFSRAHGRQAARLPDLEPGEADAIDTGARDLRPARSSRRGVAARGRGRQRHLFPGRAPHSAVGAAQLAARAGHLCQRRGGRSRAPPRQGDRIRIDEGVLPARAGQRAPGGIAA